MIAHYVKKHTDSFYAVFRILVGLLFAQHGLQKLLGWFGGLGGSGATAAFPTLIWWAGVIELVGGLLIALGLFTRLGALIAALEIFIAYIRAHAPQGFAPIANGGELAALYFASFLPILAMGAKKWSLEQKLFKKERF